jgi:hypothetical protein
VKDPREQQLESLFDRGDEVDDLAEWALVRKWKGLVSIGQAKRLHQRNETGIGSRIIFESHCGVTESSRQVW